MFARPLLSIASAMLLAACSSGVPGTPATEAQPLASELPRAAQEDQVVVSTNEPFWQARVEGDTLLLTGVDTVPRLLAGVVSSMTSDGQRFSATDAAGSVVVVVQRVACEDSMSGARFPMTGSLSIDGRGPYQGCARPLSMPQPRPPEQDAGVAPAPTQSPSG